MFSFLYDVIVSPIELVVEFVFGLMFRMLGQGETNQGLAVVGVSLAISFLTLPLYRRADIVQQHERETRMRMSVMLNRIRAVFSGDERFMMIQAYYREQGYSPIHALKGSVSLLLEIPFFIAAYHFLSNLEILDGAPFGIIADLGKPDRLIGFGGHSINLLPILMTFINCVSAAVYFRGFALKDKLQTYGLALVFLVLLYNSPSGLVVYWTCNNIFSLAKNIFYNLRNPRTVFSVVCALSGTIFAVCATLSGVLNSRKKYVAVFLFMACSFIPLVCLKIKKKPAAKRKEAGVPVPMPVFFVSAFVLSVLLGVLIPSGVIESSPAEFIDVGDFRNPLHFLRFSLAYALGFFVLWAGIVFAIMGKAGQNRFSAVFCAISVVFIVDYMCFSRNLGLLSSYLVFDNDPEFPKLGVILNLFVVALLFGGVMFVCRFRRGVVAATYVSVMLLFSVSVLSFVNVHRTQAQFAELSYVKSLGTGGDDEKPVFSLSRTGKNVVVLMLDRAISGYFPLLLEEKPFLKEQFSGFTFYPNTVSFGAHTIFCAPPLFGGYEYTPEEMNKRGSELLRDKHNESLLVMPALFSRSGWDVTVCDAPFANYKWVPDMSIYDSFPDIKTHVTERMYLKRLCEKYQLLDNGLQSLKRNFFCYSLFKVSPVFMQSFLYDDGDYYSSCDIAELFPKDFSKNPDALVFTKDFAKGYAVLDALCDATEIKDGGGNSFIMMCNNTTHEPLELYLPDYTVAETERGDFCEGQTFQTEVQRTHWHVNMAAMLKLGEWFDFMRRNGVWDNTRIIIASDHGKTMDRETEGLGFFDYMIMDDPDIDVEIVNPLLLVKDFGGLQLRTADDFMTIADVPFFAMEGIIEKPVNPFTNRLMDNGAKMSGPQLVTSSHKASPSKQADRTTFDTSDGHWFSVHDDIFDERNWGLME